ncbi:MAG: NAD(P)-dependent oxidoreductase [Candidatus Bathyarchaeota archaeon]|nr:MAG: NAD(P)-dependent oxidoreductase [Candidatus Bathyarchaeota archaeon]
MKRIGFIGLGLMGKPMALNLMKAGYKLCVYNRTRSKMEDLVAEGAIPTSSPKEVTEKSDIIITMVSDSPDVQEVVLGPLGVIEGCKKGKILIDMSTISPKTSKSISKKLMEKEVQMLDAPVSGGTIGAREGRLTIMVGGLKETFEKCLPIFKILGTRVVYMGGSGMGQATKLCNQVICAINIQSVCEGLLLGKKLNLNLEKLLEVVTGGAANSWMLTNLGPKMIIRNFQPGFKISHQIKDVRLALSTGAELELPLPCTALVQQFLRSVEAENMGDKGTQALIITMEKLAQTQILE